MVRYVIAMGLFAAESYDEVMRRMVGNLRKLGSWNDDWQVPTKSAITQARQRLGPEPMKALFERAAVPLATPGTKGAWLARRRLMAIDATSFDVADTAANEQRFGRMGSGPKASAYPKLHVAALAECGSHAIVGAVLGGCRTGERTLAADLTSTVGPGMLVMADAGLYSYDLFTAFAATGADLAWRIGASVSVGHLRWLPDGSYQAVLAGQINDPWQQQTAHRLLSPASWGTPQHSYAHFVRTAKTRARTWVAATSSWRRTETEATFDTTYGQPTLLQDKGDTSTGSDDVCTTTSYARNTVAPAWLIDFPAQQLVTNCAVSPSGSDYLGGSQVFYDGSATVGAAPSFGLPTKTTVLATVVGSTLTWDQSTRAAYDTHGRILDAYDALDRMTSTEYTPTTGGPVTATEITNPAMHVTETTLDPAYGQPTSVTDPNLKVTDLEYDPLGRLVKVWLPGRSRLLSGNQEYVYTVRDSGDASVVTSKTLGPNGNQILGYQFLDGLLRPRQTQTLAASGGRVIADTAFDERGLGVKASTFYNSTAPTDAMVAFTDSDIPRQTTTVIDTLGRTTDVIAKNNGVELWRTHTAYDGDRSLVTPPAGGTVTTALVDARGKTVELRQHQAATPTGTFDTTTYGYDRLGRLTTVTDPVSNDWLYNYDLRGRQTQAVDPDTGTTVREFDDAGQLTTTTDGRGEVVANVYDSLGRVVERRDDSTVGTLRASWVYDTVAKGQLTSATRRDTLLDYTSEILTYSDLYQPTSSRVTIPGDPSLSGLSGSYTFDTTYHVDGSVATQTLPAAGGLAAETLTTTYTTQAGVATVAGLSTYLAGAVYDWDDQITQQTLGSGSNRALLSVDYENSTGRLQKTQVHTEHPGTPNTWDEVVTEQYRWYDAGTLKSTIEQHNSVTTSAQCFTYDHLQRLSEAWTNAAFNCTTVAANVNNRGPDPYWTTWAFDPTGNRTSQTAHSTNGGSDVVTTYTYPNPGGTRPHALTSYSATTGSGTFTYDDSGNTLTRNVAGTTQTLTWDPEGHLATHAVNGQTSSYLYTPDGNRLIRRDPTGTTLYLPGTEIRRSTTAVITATRYYPNALRTTAGGLTWTAGDHHGTPHTTINATTLAVTRRLTLPYGEPRGAQPAWPDDHGFVGGPTDTTGLTHLGAREYDLTTGRFVSVDPVIDVADPQQMHGYAYANNNPTSGSDPHGLLKLIDADTGGGCYPDCSYKTPSGADVTKPVGAGNQTGCIFDMCFDPTQVTDVDKLATHIDAALARYGVTSVDAMSDAQKIAVLSMACLASLTANDGACSNAFMLDSTIAHGDIVAHSPAAERDRAVLLNSPFWILGLILTAAANDDLRHAMQTEAMAGALAQVSIGHPIGRLPLRRGLCSFSEDTPVLLGDGTTKPIKDIKVGDTVVATDPETGRQEPKTVEALWIHQDTLIALTVNDSRVLTTEDHPFYNATDRQWQEAQDLESGDQVHTVDGRKAVATGLVSDKAQTGDAYNLTVQTIHTYYVLAGNTPVLVHNCPDDIPSKFTWPRQQGGNCLECATRIQAEIGGDITHITPRGAPRLGSSTHDPNGNWFEHYAVVKDGRVYDGTTGPNGLTPAQYKAQWGKNAPYINFGF